MHDCDRDTGTSIHQISGLPQAFLCPMACVLTTLCLFHVPYSLLQCFLTVNTGCLECQHAVYILAKIFIPEYEIHYSIRGAYNTINGDMRILLQIVDS